MGWIYGAVVLLFILLLVYFRSSYERKTLEITKYTVEKENLPEGFSGYRIVFLSDLHGHRIGEKNQVLIEKIREQSPDLILFGGDMMTVKSWAAEDLSALQEILSAFYGKVKMVYANGNHELRMREKEKTYPGWYEAFLKLLRDYEVTYLCDETVSVDNRGEYILVSGIDFDRKYFKKGTRKLETGYIRKKLGEKPEGFMLVLSHTPLYFNNFASYGAELVLSGHFHGGIIRIPYLGGLITPQLQIFSKYAKGRLDKGNTTEIISGGIGTHSVNIRLFNKPEIPVIILKRKENT